MFPPVLTPEEEVQLEKEWQAKAPEVATRRETTTQKHLCTATEKKMKHTEQEKSANQMETEEPEREPSTVESTMEPSEMDTTCDRHILPLAESPIEEAYHQHLLEKEDDEAIWKLIALRYLDRIGRAKWLKH